MDFCDGKDLLAKIRENQKLNQRFTEEEIWYTAI